MEETLVFVYADNEAAEKTSAPFSSRGYGVEILSPDSDECLEAIALAQPVAVVLDISEDWMAPVVIAQGILADERLSRPLLVFVDGTPESVAQCKATLPFGVYVRPEELVWVLKRLGLTV